MSIGVGFHHAVSAEITFYDNDSWACIKLKDKEGTEVNIFVHPRETEFLQQLRNCCKEALSTL